MKKLLFVFAFTMIAMSLSFAYTGGMVVAHSNNGGGYVYNSETYNICASVIQYSMELFNDNTMGKVTAYTTNGEMFSVVRYGQYNSTILPVGEIYHNSYNIYEVKLEASAHGINGLTFAWSQFWY